MVYFIAKAVEERRQASGGRWVTGDQLMQSDGGFDFQGFNQVSCVNTHIHTLVGLKEVKAGHQCYSLRIQLVVGAD